ncbi:MAG: glycolate oxidase subunit GlcF [Pseudomonadales bacterium]
MQTSLPENLLATSQGQRADAILRSCVHCGFCNATCPTYQVLGDELDGPRGRIYLIKTLLESEADEQVKVAERAEQHLDRCLTCRACETTCPSGVAYGELLELGRAETDRIRPRRGIPRLMRRWLVTQMSSTRRVRRWSRLGRLFAFVLPNALKRNVPPKPNKAPVGEHTTRALSDPALSGMRVLLLDGCVQEAATPATNQTLSQLLQRRGAEVVRLPKESCCGALALHLNAQDSALAAARKLLDQFEAVADEVDVVVSTASGCGVTQRDYPRLFEGESGHYRLLARTFAEKLQDASELLSQSRTLEAQMTGQRIAWHAPCTLQHGQRTGEDVPRLLQQAGYELVPVRDSHLCCGSAGTYSVLQPALCEELGERKLQALTSADPQLIATANVGCQLHLSHGAQVPVKHWLELLQ